MGIMIFQCIGLVQTPADFIPILSATVANGKHQPKRRKFGIHIYAARMR